MSRSKSQQGSLLIVVIFVLVVMGFLATHLSRIQWSNTDSHAKELLGTQAWLLAQSVNEDVLTRFYPLDSVSSAVKANCKPKDQMALPDFTDGDGKFTEVTMNCQLKETSCGGVGKLDGIFYYKLTARVVCGSGKSAVERSEEIWVRESE